MSSLGSKTLVTVALMALGVVGLATSSAHETSVVDVLPAKRHLLFQKANQTLTTFGDTSFTVPAAPHGYTHASGVSYIHIVGSAQVTGDAASVRTWDPTFKLDGSATTLTPNCQPLYVGLSAGDTAPRVVPVDMICTVTQSGHGAPTWLAPGTVHTLSMVRSAALSAPSVRWTFGFYLIQEETVTRTHPDTHAEVAALQATADSSLAIVGRHDANDVPHRATANSTKFDTTLLLSDVAAVQAAVDHNEAHLHTIEGATGADFTQVIAMLLSQNGNLSSFRENFTTHDANQTSFHNVVSTQGLVEPIPGYTGGQTTILLVFGVLLIYCIRKGWYWPAFGCFLAVITVPFEGAWLTFSIMWILIGFAFEIFSVNKTHREAVKKNGEEQA